MRSFFITITATIIILCTTATLFSKRNNSIVTVTGFSTSQNMSAAIIEAQNDAKVKAIEEIAGVKLKISSSLIKKYQTNTEIVLAKSIGKIQKSKMINWQVKNLIEDSEKLPFVQLSVEMEIEVTIPEITPDPNYKLTGNLENEVVFVGKQITIENIQATENSYLYFFSINRNKVYPLIPNKLISELSIKTDETLSFPSKELKKKGLRLYAEKVTKEEVEYEQLIVLAVKKNKNSIIESYLAKHKTISVKEFSEILVKIPLNERVFKIFDYEIREEKE